MFICMSQITEYKKVKAKAKERTIKEIEVICPICRYHCRLGELYFVKCKHLRDVDIQREIAYFASEDD